MQEGHHVIMACRNITRCISACSFISPSQYSHSLYQSPPTTLQCCLATFKPHTFCKEKVTSVATNLIPLQV